MNSKERRKDRKARELMKLGRKAKVEIAAAHQQVEGLAAELAAKDDRLRAGMHAAADLEEAFLAAEQHVARLNEEHEEEKRRIHREHLETKQRMEAEYSAALEAEREKARMAEAARDAMRAMVAEPKKLRERLREKQREIDRLTRELNLALQKPTEAQPIVILSAAAEREIAARDARLAALRASHKESGLIARDSLGRVLGATEGS